MLAEETLRIINSLATQVQALAGVIPKAEGRSSKIKMSELEDYDGKPEKSDSFIAQCTTYFLNDPEATDKVKILCALSHMKTGTVLQFAENVRRL